MRIPEHPAHSDGIIYGCVQAQSCSFCMRRCSAGICWSHFYTRDLGSCYSSCCWYPLTSACRGIKLFQEPSQPHCLKDMFFQCLFDCFHFHYTLCYNNTPQHIHGTFNHSEAWDNLERKLNIINFYFRGKEIKTQEKGPAQDELQKSQTHVGLPASAVSCLQDLIYAKGIFESLLSQLRVIFFLQHHTSQARTKILWHGLSLNLRA